MVFICFPYVSIDLRCYHTVWVLYNIKEEVGCTPARVPNVQLEAMDANSSIVPGARVANGCRERSGAERSGAGRSGAERSGAERSEAERSGAKRSGAERRREEKYDKQNQNIISVIYPRHRKSFNAATLRTRFPFIC